MTATQLRELVKGVVESHATHNTFYSIWSDVKDRETELTYPCAIWDQWRSRLEDDEFGHLRRAVLVRLLIITAVATDRTPEDRDAAVEAADNAASDYVLKLRKEYPDLLVGNVGCTTQFDEYTQLETGVLLTFTVTGEGMCLDEDHFVPNECPTFEELIAGRGWASIKGAMSEAQVDAARDDLDEPPTVNGVESETHTITVLQGGSPVGALDPTSGVVTVPPCDPCPPCADAEVRVNGVVYDAVASGGVIDIPVVADGGGVVGTVTAGVEVTIARSEIRTTAADTIITMLPAEQGLNLPQTRVRYYDAAGVVQLYAPSDTGYAGGTLGQMVPVPRIIIYESDGVTPHVYRDIATPAFTLPAPPVVPLKYGFGPGGGITPTWTVTADEAGTYNTYTQDGGSGTVEYKRNAGAWTVVSGTIVLAVGDTITVRRSITTNTGFSRWVP